MKYVGWGVFIGMHYMELISYMSDDQTQFFGHHSRFNQAFKMPQYIGFFRDYNTSPFGCSKMMTL